MSRVKLALMGLVMLLVGLIGISVYAADVSYRLNPVKTNEDVVSCGMAGGRGAIVYELDKEGNAISDGAAFCVLAN